MRTRWLRWAVSTAIALVSVYRSERAAADDNPAPTRASGPAAVVARAAAKAPGLIGVRASQLADLPLHELGSIDALPHYELDLALHDDLGGYTLDESIVYTNTTDHPLPDLVLRLFGNSGPEQLIELERGHCPEQVCVVDQPGVTLVHVRPDAPLAPGAALRVRLQLRGRLRVIDAAQTDMLTQGLQSIGSLLSGEQTGDYGLLSVGEGIASLANFYAVVAHRRDDGWVASEGKALGDLGAQGVSIVHASVHAARDVMIASSGVIAESLGGGDARRRLVTIDANLVRDFALFASRQFKQQTRQVGDVTVRAYALAPDAASNASVLQTASDALRVFERRFGPYPYTELDVVEAPLVGGAGGAEFSGIVSVASMLYRPLMIDKDALGLLGGAQGSPLEFTTAHEVAHQYWYGLVGSDARQSPYVDESLTQWSAVLFFEERYGPERAQREADAQVRMNYRLMRLLGGPDAAVDRPVDAFDSALAYAGLVYGKGAYMYPTLRKLCGDAAYFAALRSYVRRYRFQQVPSNALIDMFGKHCADPARVRGLARRWLKQRHGDEDLGASTLESMLASVAGQDEHASKSHDAKSNAARRDKAASGGLELGALSSLLKSFLGDAAAAPSGKKGKQHTGIDARALESLLGQLQHGRGALGGGLDQMINGLMRQVDQGIDQLPMPEH